MGQLRLALLPGFWQVGRDGDEDCRAIQRRHYSRRIYRDGRDPKKFVGPGSHIVLVGAELNCLFVWRKFIDDCDDGSGSRQEGINCAIFRNESSERSSSLILEAEPFAWAKWVGERRLYTLVDPRKVRSTNPGYCFLQAGWRRAGTSKNGKIILDKFR